MTFMDEVHSDWEIDAKKSAQKLIIWLQTIAPISDPDLVDALWGLAKQMDWPHRIDEQGIKIL